MNFEKSKGAISIFLVIILVPMMTVSSLFVDVSKVSLARAVADSASDLALNTALSCYDTDLKDLYGLLATAQDTSELYSSLEDYYRTSIISAGVSAEDADSYVEQIMAQLGMVEESNDTADILGMQLIDFGVEKRDDLTLANPTLLKSQIVEFMKYRSPINTGLSFIEALQTFKTLDKQTELVDKRTQYYTEEQSVMEAAYEAWKQIKLYAHSKFVKNYSYFETMEADFGTYQDTYDALARRIVKDLYDIDGYTVFNGKMYSIEDAEVTLENGLSYSGLVFFTNEEQTSFRDTPADLTTYSEDPAGADDFRQALEDLYDAGQEYAAAADAMFSFGAEKGSGDYTFSADDIYPLQYLVQVQRNDLYDRWIDTIVDYYDAYAMLVHCFEHLGDDVDITSLKAEMCGSSTSRSYGDYYQSLRGEFEIESYCFRRSDDGEPNNKRNDISEINSRLDICENKTKTILGGDPAATEKKVSDLYQQVSSYRAEVQNAYNYLTAAKPYLQTVYDKIKEGGTLSQKKSEWSAAASDGSIRDTTMAKQDNAEIDSLSTYLKPDYVDDMIKRIDEILPHLQDMLDQIDSYQIYGTSIWEIDTLGTFRYVLGEALGDSELKNAPLKETELDGKVEEWCADKFTIGQTLSTVWDKPDPHLSDLSPLNFYGYLYQHFGDSIDATEVAAQESEKNEAENLYSQMKTKTEDTAKAQADAGSGGGTDKDIASCPDKESLPSVVAKSAGSASSMQVNTKIDSGEDDGNGGQKPNAVQSTAGGLGGMFGSLGSALVDLGKGLRDNLYVSDYMLSMFSYDTIEKELAKKAEENGSSADPDEKPMTLTKVELNAETCYAYQREVEYILYGGSNADNLLKSYGSIYGIRLGFNLIYAFSSSEIRETAFAIATPISAATMGIIPVPLIQAALIIGIACVESGFDLNHLRQGEKVPLFKNDKTWHASVRGLIEEIKGETGKILNEASDKAIDKSVSVLSDLLDKTDAELTKYIDEKGNAIIEDVTAEFDTVIVRHAETAIQKLTTLANNAIEQSFVEPATNTAQYVKDGLQNWLAEEASANGSSGLAYKAKEIAVNEIMNRGYIDQVLSAINAQKKNALSAVTDLENGLKDCLDAVRRDIQNAILFASDELERYKDDIKKQMTGAITDGAASLKTSLNSSIANAFGSADMTQVSDNSGMSSLLSFRYSDYLRLFLLIGMYTNQEALLYRTADVIQVNMDLKQDGYLLSDSAVYVTLNADILVKPTLLALPLFSKVKNNPVNNASWYSISVEDIRGY